MTPTSEGKIGKYEIIRVLGRGGMGEVLLAEDRTLGRRVAIKRPFKSAMQDGLARFQLEARAATLNHRNIPAVYELGVEDGLPFIAMEYVEGEPLDQILASGRDLALIVKLSIIEQVCSALDHAHQQGIIHRDIKPANVIVRPDGVIKIIDFGIAKMQSTDPNSGLTQPSQIIGSLHYIAPERFRGEVIDGRADIFSTGVMLYLLLTGHLPFSGAEATATYKILNESHTALSTHIQNYPPALDTILDRALAKNPAQRYASAEDFAEALHEVIDELKRNRVFQLFDDAERLATERRFEPALELLNEAMGLDPANTQVRKLRKFVREQQDKVKRGENLRSMLVRADEALEAENYAEALALLKEASALDPAFGELKEKIRAIEEKKRLNDKSVAALANAEAIRDKDINGAVRLLEKALVDDPSNIKLLTVLGALSRQAQSEAQHAGLQELFETARTELAARHFSQVEELLTQAKSLDAAHPDIDKLTAEMTRLKEQEERRRVLDEIQRRVYELVQSNHYSQAAELVDRALDKLPSESTLHRLKAEVAEHVRQVTSKRAADDVISRARELSQTAPADALALVTSALDHTPGDERLIAYEKTLRQQVESARLNDLCQSTIHNARELIDSKQYEQAIGVLEAYQAEHEARPEINDFLGFAREEFAKSQRQNAVEQCLAEARSLQREGRLEEAIRCVESCAGTGVASGIATTNDASLARLLTELRDEQQSSARKTQLLFKRVEQLRDRNEVDEAIQLLRQQLVATPSNAAVAAQLNALVTGQGHAQTIANAIASAREAAMQGHFATGLESLEAVEQGYGRTSELTLAIHELRLARSAHAREAVGKAIEMANDLLTQNNGQAAISILTSVASMLEFVDAQKQADWQTARQSVQRQTGPDQSRAAQSGPGQSGLGQSEQGQSGQGWTTPSTSAAPPPGFPPPAFAPPPLTPPPTDFSRPSGPTADTQNFVAGAQTFGSAPPKRSNGLLIWLIVLLALIGLGAGAFIYWKMHPGSSAQSYIRINRVPVGAMVSIDHGTPQPVDGSGQFKAPVQPGDHVIEVTQQGFDPFSEKVTVEPSATMTYPSVSLTKTLAAGTTGKLLPQGNIADFRLTVDAEYRGLLHEGDTVSLEPGVHTVRYENTDNSDSQQHTVTIAANQDLPDPFSLKAPKASQAKFTNPVHTKPQIGVDANAKPNGNAQPKPSKDRTDADSTESEIEKIKTARERFEAAYDSKDLARLQSEWLDIGKARSDGFEVLFKRPDLGTVKIQEKCSGQPTVTGPNAEWRCLEVLQMNDRFFKPAPKTLTFSKVGPKWILRDK